MKFIASIILTALLSFTTSLFLPWWFIAIAALLVAVAIPQKPIKSFLSGFIALLLLWSGLSFYISNNNQHILAHKMSLLVLQTDNVFLLILLTGLIGALVAGFAALTGSYVRKK